VSKVAAAAVAVAAVFLLACEPPPEEFTAITCQLDDGPIEHCTTPVTYTGLAAGEHRVVVSATNFQKRDGEWVWSETSTDEWTWTVLPP
jgi:hypothetical protein